MVRTVTVSQALADAIASGKPQRVLLEFLDDNGDVVRAFSNEDVAVTNGVTLRETFNGDTDLTIGQCPSAEISFTLLNDINQITTFEFGKFRAWLGVRIDGATYRTVENSEFDAGHYVAASNGAITMEDGEPKVGSSANARLWMTECSAGDTFKVAGVAPGTATRLYLFANSAGTILQSYSNRYTALQETEVTAPSDSAWFIFHKMSTGSSSSNVLKILSSPATDYTKTFTEGGQTKTYAFAPLGVFIADRPDVVRKQMIDIRANDQMTLFDKEWGSAGISIAYPITAANLLTAICTAVGVTCVTSTFLNSDVTLTKKPSGMDNMTLREIIGWIAEAAASVARFNREGNLELVWFAPIARSFDEHGYVEFTPAWYEVKAIDKLAVRNASQTSEVVEGTGDNTYVITNNPFLRT